MARIVIDANLLVHASIDEAGLGPLAGHDLHGPPLIRSEALSTLHELRYRDDISLELATIARRRLNGLHISIENPPTLSEAAWRVAEQLGWAKTYDAEYVALAQILDVPLVTLDRRLMRGAGRLAKIIGPSDL